MKYLKKILILGLVFTIFAGVKSASAAELEIKNNVVTGVKKAEGAIKIPEGVTAIGDAAFKGNQTIHTVYIPEGVTKIGKEAFCNCKNLVEVVLPKSMTSIGKNAFKGIKVRDTGIGPTVHYAKGTSSKVVKWLRDNELNYWSYDCSLERMMDPNCVSTLELRVYPKAGSRKIVNRVVYRITKKTEKVREVEVRRLDRQSDRFDYETKEVTVAKIPAFITLVGKKYKVTSISKNAFKNNKNLKKIAIGKNVKVIKNRAFANCKNIKSITIQNPNCKYSGKRIWKRINKNVKIYVPKSALSKQKRRLKKSGFPYIDNVKGK